jgi:hypothetical protein
MPTFVNPFEIPGRWYKANFHTHSTLSDGALPPAERVAQYREAGYSVLAMTDHRRTQDIRGLGDKKILVLGGMEVHPVCHSPKGWWHIVAVGVPRELAFVDPPEDCNETIAAIRASGGVAILAHPAWCGQTFDDFSGLKGLDAMEVWNSVCDLAGRPSSENEWATALDRGWQIPVVASDDCHHAYDEDVCESWTWLKMKSLTKAAVLSAIRSGACYASCGPTIHDFRLEGGKIRIRCSAAAQIHIKGPPGLGVRKRAAEGESITSFAGPADRLPGWPWPYVRAVVTDARGRKAWTNPLYPTAK